MSRSGIDKEFSWLPPPITVVAVSPKWKKRADDIELRNNESFLKPPENYWRSDRTERKGESCDKMADLRHDARNRSWTIDTVSTRNSTQRPRSLTHQPQSSNGRNNTESKRDSKSDRGRSRERVEQRLTKEVDRMAINDKEEQKLEQAGNHKANEKATRDDDVIDHADSITNTSDQMKDNDEKNGRPSGEILNQKEVSVFMEEKVGKEAVQLERVFSSRKISQLNPSPKFIALSYQRDDDNTDGKSFFNDGSMYARRLKQPEDDCDNTKSEMTKEGKKHKRIKKSKLKKKKKESVRKLGVVTEGLSDELTVDKVENQETTNLVHRIEDGDRAIDKKISVFEMKEFDDQILEIDQVMKRKMSDPEHEKVISVSYESERVRKNNIFSPQTLRRMHGGMYAKKLLKNNNP